MTEQYSVALAHFNKRIGEFMRSMADDPAFNQHNGNTVICQRR